VAVRWPQDGPAAPLCDGPKRAPSRGDHNGERERAVAWRCVWPGAPPTFLRTGYLALCRGARRRADVLMCPGSWGALQQRTAECICLVPWLLGALWRRMTAQRRAALPGAAAARAQQPGANARFSFWALLGLSGRASCRVARAPLRTAWALRGVAPSKVPVFLSPAPFRPWQGPGWPFQKASG
jgi:hypothetical protein